MKSTKNFIATIVITAVVLIAGCAKGNVRALPQISSADTTGVWMLVSEDGTSVTLSGQVKHSVERKIIEDFVRAEYDYRKITNSITSN